MIAIARLARVTCLAAFGLIVLGGVVRSTGSGLACPDWPLCHGQIVPPFQPQVLFEWGHRLVALLVSVGTLGLAVLVYARRAARDRLGRLMAVVLALLATQIVLGALTVWKLLAFAVVTLHLANGLLFFAALLALAERAGGAAGDDAGPGSGAAATGGHAGWFALATAATLAQTLLGGLVSTNHAGLACPDFPTCRGMWLPPLVGLVRLQVVHRLGAYALAVFLALVAWRAWNASDSRIAVTARLAPSLVVLQIVLGAFNVLLGVPVWITAAHLATAALLFALLWLATLRARAQVAA
jgi:cytochrome c oxidase assembly protein subunit 15